MVLNRACCSGVMAQALAALKEALKHANEAAVATLLDAHPTLLEQDGGAELLKWAIDCKREDMVRALAQRGVNLEASTLESLTALQWAAKYGHEKMTRVLLEHGAQATNQGVRGVTSLIHASIKGHMGVVRLLLQYLKGQGLEEEDAYNRTALTHAASNGHWEVVKLLLKSGAIPHFWDGCGMTPLMHGSFRSVGVVQALLPYLNPHQVNVRGALKATASHYACTDNVHREGWLDPEIVKALFLAGANPTITDERGRTPRACAEAIRDPELRAEFVDIVEVSLTLPQAIAETSC